MLKNCVLGAALLGAALATPAQVMKCVDRKTGAVTYSDSACSPAQSGAQLLEAKTPEMQAQERLQYEQAMQRKWQEQQREALQEARPQSATGAAQAAPLAAAPQGGFECRQAQQELETVASITTLSPEAKSARVAIANQKMNQACHSQAPNPAPAIIVTPAPSRRYCVAGHC